MSDKQRCEISGSTSCEISGQLTDIKADLTEIKDVIYRYDGIISRMDKMAVDISNKQNRLELEMRAEIENVRVESAKNYVDMNNKIQALQNRFNYIWIGLTFLIGLISLLWNILGKSIK